jgi:MFS family permease
MAFGVIGGAGLVATLLLVLLVREPVRGAQEAKLAGAEAPAVVDKPSFFSTAGAFFGRPTLLFTALGCGAAAFIGYAVLNWTAPFLTRVKGINMGEIALWYSLELAVCMGVGTWLAGAIADWLSRRAKIWYALVPAIALALAIPFSLAFVWAPTWQMSLAFLAIPTLLNNCYLAPALAVVQNSVKPSQRTMSGALLLMVLNLIGLGLGPTYIGEMSTRFTEGNIAAALGVSAADAVRFASMSAAELGQQGAEVASAVAASAASGLQSALYWLTPFYAVAIGLLLVEGFFLAREGRRERAA